MKMTISLQLLLLIYFLCCSDGYVSKMLSTLESANKQFVHQIRSFYEASIQPFQYGINADTVKTRLFKSLAVVVLISPLGLGGVLKVNADDELAKFAASGNVVKVDSKCFMNKCAAETKRCANDQTCLKGLTCLARLVYHSMMCTSDLIKESNLTVQMQRRKHVLDELLRAVRQCPTGRDHLLCGGAERLRARARQRQRQVGGGHPGRPANCSAGTVRWAFAAGRLV